MRKNILTAALGLLLLNCLFGQESVDLFFKWNEETLRFSENGKVVEMPTFLKAVHHPDLNYLPRKTEVIEIPRGRTVTDVSIVDLEFSGDFNSKLLGSIDLTSPAIRISWAVREERGKRKLIVEYLPINASSGRPLKVAKARLTFKTTSYKGGAKSNSFADNSVLSSGEWFKIGVTEDGVYRLDRNDLSAAGIDVDVLNPQNLNIFGNGFGQLPYENETERPDDLLANAIFIEGEGDESFDEGDFILFYAKGPHTWTFDPEVRLFDHAKHEYCDTSYYYIGVNTGVPAKRISNLESTGSSPTVEVNDFNDYVFHEVDRENVLKSGRTWYGEKFDVQTSYNFSGERFTFPNILADSSVTLRAALISRSTAGGSSVFQMSLNGNSQSASVGNVGVSVTSSYAREVDLTLITNTPAPSLNIGFDYSKSLPSDIGWLDWFNVNLRRELRMAGAQMEFRDVNSVGPGQVARFNLSNAGSIAEIWEVTDPTNVRRIVFNLSNETASFTLPTEDLREFVAFTGSSYLTPEIFGEVGNQNIHALGLNGGVDMVIVVPAFMYSQAEELAEIHRNYVPDPLNVEVVKLHQVYNEFSSGMRDVTAIKWLMKMFYDRAGGNPDQAPRCLLLFGDGSYDNVNTTQSNTNLIPTYQSLNSLSPVRSYVSDDYFGLLSDDDGEDPVDLMDISVGRLVVKNQAEASSVVSKIRRYIENPQGEQLTCSGNESSFGSWRNIIALVADDEDGNDHMEKSSAISSQIESYTKDFNIERIFTDAFQQVATPGGDRYPDVNAAIDRRVRNGAFIINYIGHGGELGWAQERILDIPTILAWDNTYNMPIFMTATCEFTRFDDPLRTSAGEFVLLNAGGGGVALLTTTRLVYAEPNFQLNVAFYEALFNRPESEDFTRLGDVYRDCKNNSVSAGLPNHRNFSLVGDPALPMAVPDERVEILSITDTLGNPVDTLKALGVARIMGTVVSAETGQLLSGFDGFVEATVFDRVKQRNTLGNDGGNTFTYPTQEGVIYKGFAEVTNGNFSFDFVLPKDISFAVDSTARISLYAFSSETDAAGFRDELLIGDRDENAINDEEGPDIDLFMNDENFVFGGYTNTEPVLLAKVFDPNGINTVGTGIGHDISAVIDGDVSNTLVLNDYYESDLNTFKSGIVRYPFDELEPGNHSVELTVWDVHNNSNKSYLEFVVAESNELAIERVLNYPNPFTTNTEFYFEHNQSCEFLNVLIQIYTVSGKLVKTINTVSNTDGFRNEPIPWDGRDDYGDRLATGTYVYKVSVMNPSGERAEKFEKLVKLN